MTVSGRISPFQAAYHVFPRSNVPWSKAREWHTSYAAPRTTLEDAEDERDATTDLRDVPRACLRAWLTPAIAACAGRLLCGRFIFQEVGDGKNS